MARAAMKFAATAPKVLGSAAILTVVGPLVPAWAGTGLGLIILGVLVVAAGVGEAMAARLLRGARPLDPVHQQLLAPAVTQLTASGKWPADVEVRVLPRAWGVDVGATGRRTVLVTEGLFRALDRGALSRQEAAAMLVHGLGRLTAGTTRSDLAIQAACLPAAVPLQAARGLLNMLQTLPLVLLAWALRGVVGLIAVVHAGLAGHWPIAVLLTALVVLSYTTPWAAAAWSRADQAAGDLAVVEAGLGTDLAHVLARIGALTPDRRLRLDPPAAHLRLVPARTAPRTAHPTP